MIIYMILVICLHQTKYVELYISGDKLVQRSI